MNPIEYHFVLPKDRKPTNIKIPEVWYPNINEHWEKCTTERIYNPIFGIKAIVIHATAGHASSHVIPLMKNGISSWHWLVPDENEPEHEKLVWACAPETLSAWHVRNDKFHPEVNQGKNKVNHWSLGIEIVNSQMNDPFSDWQVKITADIVKYCWAKYPNLEHIVSHAKLDPNRRTDPGKEFPWQKFKEYVLDADYGELIVFNELVEKRRSIKTVEGIKSDELCC
ncbi:MAG: N-acetylmuramoyl-L-alanine amidase [Aurantibacter sp.]